VRTYLYLEGLESITWFHSKRRSASGEAKRDMVDNSRTDYTLIVTFVTFVMFVMFVTLVIA
jgi:hypothetical protein